MLNLTRRELSVFASAVLVAPKPVFSQPKQSDYEMIVDEISRFTYNYHISSWGMWTGRVTGLMVGASLAVLEQKLVHSLKDIMQTRYLDNALDFQNFINLSYNNNLSERTRKSINAMLTTIPGYQFGLTAKEQHMTTKEQYGLPNMLALEALEEMRKRYRGVGSIKIELNQLVSQI